MKSRSIYLVVLLSFLGVDGPVAADIPFGRSFRVEYVWKDHFWERELEVYVSDVARGSARLRFTGDSRGKPWDSVPLDVKCRLDQSLVGHLRVLLQKADVFADQHWGYDGRGQHFALETLYVGDGARTVAAVVSFNDSYEQGVRHRLVQVIRALSVTLAKKSPLEVCTFDSLDLGQKPSGP